MPQVPRAQTVLNFFKQDLVNLVHHSYPNLASLRGLFHCIVDFKSACFFALFYAVDTHFLTKTPCPTYPSHPSVPKGHHGTSRDVPWCPSTQLSVPSVHPIPQSQRDVWNIMGCSMELLNTALCPRCLSMKLLCTILYS